MGFIDRKDLVLVPNTEIKKEILGTREGFGEGMLNFFWQRFWIPSSGMVQRHRHPVMRELIMAVDGDFHIALQDKPEGPETLLHIPAGQLVIIEPNTLHTLMNRTDKEVLGIAVGLILEPNGTTINE